MSYRENLPYLDNYLMWAIRAGDLSEIRRLIENKGANANFYICSRGFSGKDNMERNAYNSSLVEAVKSENLIMVQYLVSKGASINIGQGIVLETCVQILSEKSLNILEFLLTNGGDPNLVQANGNPLLYEASRIKNYQAVALLIKHGAVIQRANPSALRWAILNNDESSFYLLAQDLTYEQIKEINEGSLDRIGFDSIDPWIKKLQLKQRMIKEFST